MSRIIALSTPRVKPNRIAPRPEAPFGAGISLRAPRSEQPSADDAQWWAENSPANATGYETDFAAGCSMASSRMSAGYGLL